VILVTGAKDGTFGEEAPEAAHEEIVQAVDLPGGETIDDDDDGETWRLAIAVRRRHEIRRTRDPEETAEDDPLPA
jgi:hypothetical protein